MHDLAAPENRRPIRSAWRPAFRADWAEATFVHFSVPPRVLQPRVPFPLDLHEGRAYVSLVAFTMTRLRPAFLDSALGELLLRPIAPCRFLNVRTYVRSGAADGIYFMGEWLSHWGGIPLGPLLYGLPYHPGRLRFRGNEAARAVEIEVRGLGGARLGLRAQSERNSPLKIASPGTLEAFLLERYLAFTRRGEEPLTFRVEHEPWRAVAAEVTLADTNLLAATGDWLASAQLIGGHLSPGAFDVAMSAPRSAACHPPPRSAFLG